MLISIQYPLADSRRFVENTQRLLIPGWPDPIPDTEFVRYFGPVRIRRGGGIVGWVGENKVCEANRALRFRQNLSFHSPDTGTRLLLRCAYRRFYFDSWAVAKYEIGIATKKRSGTFLQKVDTGRLMDNFLRLPVYVGRLSEEKKPIEIGRAGKILRELHRQASTRHPNELSTETPDWWIRPGVPLLFLEYREPEVIQLPYWIKTVDLPSRYGLSLRHCYVPSPWGDFRMWIMSNGEKANLAKARDLRLYLVRLHAEHECLRLILRNIETENIQPEPRSKASRDLQFYLNKATQRIGKMEKKSGAQFDDEIAEIARASIDIISAGERERFLEKIESLDLRGNIIGKLRKYTDEWGNVEVTYIEQQFVERQELTMGDRFENISNSVIATRGSIAKGVIILEQKGQEDVAKAIADLQRLIEQAPEEEFAIEKKVESEDLLKGITEEAARPQPNKNILKTLGTSLLTIVTSVEPIAVAAKAAIEIIQKLWA